MTEYDAEGVEIVGANPAKSRARKNSAFKSKPKPASSVPVIVTAIPPMPDSVSERVSVIADMMSELQWVKGKTGKLIAKHWGLSVSTVEGYSAEASRSLNSPRDREEAKALLMTGAFNAFREAILAGDAKSAKMMGDLLADVTGASEPVKQELTHTLGDSTPKTAREIMSAVFKGDVGSEAANPVDAESEEDSDS
jgi:hypothetical protein